MAVDAPSGIMGVEMNLVYSNKPADLTYTAYMVRYMSFPPVPYVESLKIGVEYQPLFVSKPGTYSMVVVVSASDAKDHSGAPVVGRRINFDANSPYPYVLEPSGITNQVGEAINTMYITIPDLSQLPQQITVSAFEPLSEFGISITVDIQQTQSDISISDVSPGSEQGGVWLTDVNDVRVNGRVTGLNMDTVEVSVGVDTKEGSYVHDSRPKLDENGYFSVPLSMYTAGEEYKVSVTAFDASGLTVSDTVTVKYLGPSLVKILSVYNPDWVDPKQYDSFDVEVEVKVVSVEPTGLTVDLSMGSH